MTDIVAVMCVAGDPMFFKFASYSIPSFLRNNSSTVLCVFTDRPEEIAKYRNISKKLGVIDLKDYFEASQGLMKRFKSHGRSEEALKMRNEKYGFAYKDIYPMIMPPMAEATLRGKGYTHILKVDSDAYFAGGDMMALVKADVEKYDFADMFLVERRHPAMTIYGKGMPGSGFTLWRIGSKFIDEYVRSFNESQQVTVLNLRFGHGFYTKVLERPGYHVVRPFIKAEQSGMPFTKGVASQFLPAYFHLYGKNALKNMKTLDEWFGEKEGGKNHRI